MKRAMYWRTLGMSIPMLIRVFLISKSRIRHAKPGVSLSNGRIGYPRAHQFQPRRPGIMAPLLDYSRERTTIRRIGIARSWSALWIIMVRLFAKFAAKHWC